MDPSKLPPGLGTDPVPGARSSSRLAFVDWSLFAGDAFVGAASLSLALRGDTPDVFAAEVWRVVLGAMGALFTFVSLRFVLRAARGYQPPGGPERLRRAQRNGKFFALLGLWLLALALIPAVGENTIDLEPRLKVGYGIAGALNLLVGLVIQWDPTRFLQHQRVREGVGVKGRARIVRANNTGVYINESPQIEIDLRIEVEGREPYDASDKIVMQQAKLALLVPGSSVGVTVDTVDPTVFHLDWDDWRAPS